MSTAHFPQPSAVPLGATRRARKAHARAYCTKSSGTPSQNTATTWRAIRAAGFNISGSDLRLSEITALKAVSEKPNQAAFANARLALQLSELFGIDPTEVTASAEGGVALCFMVDGMYADIECFNSGEMWALISDRINPASTWAVEKSTSGIGAALLKIKNELNA